MNKHASDLRYDYDLHILKTTRYQKQGPLAKIVLWGDMMCAVKVHDRQDSR
jgi:hypothetical protein